ncbi:MAG: neutral/alkaline non-lysosomal ceramidase N-terminal domain-containing protein [Planctomycetota bacterium]|nr:neutral/alkaline non-lysosomal ceramidase N-terminal domain-containing protein [Planctomycetota bacterium]
MLKAGTSRICISPGADPKEVTTYRNPPPEGFYCDTFVKALALEDEKGQKLVIVSLDIISFREDMLERVREGIKARTGLEASQVLLCVSHTHSGPMREGPLEPFGISVEEYRQMVIDRTVDVVAGALSDTEPIDLYFGRGDLHMSINRRRRNPAGYPVWKGNPYGEVDPEVGVLKAVGKDGKVKAVVMNYACHASAIGTGLIGNDYPGFAQEIIENRYSGCTALFAQGCAGEIKPYNVDPDCRFMYKIPPAVAGGLGWELAKEVTRVVEQSALEKVDGEINIAARTIDLPMEGPPSADEVKNARGVHEDVVETWRKFMSDKIKDGTIGEIPLTRPYEIAQVKIGDRFRLVALQGEPCVRIGRRIKEQLTNNMGEMSTESWDIHSVMVFAYTNGWAGYIPSSDVLRAGGYEAESHFFHNWAGPYTADIEDIVVNGVLEL